MPVPARKNLVALLAAALVSLALPAAASADRTATVSIMDDQLLLTASRAKIDKQMAIFRKIGVDRVRVSAFWNEIAPQAGSLTKPAGFDATYPFNNYDFRRLDPVVLSADAHRLKVMISITTPAPLWATGAPSRRNPVWKPKANEFGMFAQAVATRYASYVDHYAISNEPNQQQWLQPQSEGGKFVAPHVYRAMVQAAYPRIKAADPTSTALIGELASIGSRVRGIRRGIRPLAFLRTMACRSSSYRRMTSGPCANFTPVTGDAIGHHPYQFLLAPTARSRARDEAAIGDGRRLLRVLDRLQRGGGLRSSNGRRFNVFYTEFGYQSDPPDPSGVPLGVQSRYLQTAAYLAYRTPRVKEINQFRLTDGRIKGAGPKSFAEFQSGLLFRSRRKKPSYRSFPHPFVIAGSLFWGQVRRGSRSTIFVQRRIGRRWVTVGQDLADARGYFTLRIPGRRAGLYRYKYSGGSGAKGTSSAVSVR
jgi:hypothetical protein